MNKLGLWWGRLTGQEELRRQRNQARQQLLDLVSAVSSLESELEYLCRPRSDGGVQVRIGSVTREECPLLCRLIYGLPLVPPDEGADV